MTILYVWCPRFAQELLEKLSLAEKKNEMLTKANKQLEVSPAS